MSVPTHPRVTNAQLLDLVEASLGKRPLILTVTEFASLIGRDRQTVWQACARGDIPAAQGGKGSTYRIPVQALRPYLEGKSA